MKGKGLVIFKNLLASDIDVILLWHAGDTGEDSFGGWSDQEFIELLTVFQSILDRDSADAALATGVAAPHAARDILASDALYHDGCRFLNNPDKRVRNI